MNVSPPLPAHCAGIRPVASSRQKDEWGEITRATDRAMSEVQRDGPKVEQCDPERCRWTRGSPAHCAGEAMSRPKSLSDGPKSLAHSDTRLLQVGRVTSIVPRRNVPLSSDQSRLLIQIPDSCTMCRWGKTIFTRCSMSKRPLIRQARPSDERSEERGLA